MPRRGVPLLVAVAVTVLAAGLLVWSATGDDGDESNAGPDPAATPSPSATTPEPTEPDPEPTPEPEPTPVDELLIVPGAVGPIEVGMSVDEVIASGYFEANPPPDDPQACPGPPAVWRPPYDAALDALFGASTQVQTIGVGEPGPRTRSGLQVGSTWAQVRAVVDDEPVEAGYVQTGVLVHESATDAWIGFLFDGPPSELTDDSPVVFIEVVTGRPPDLIRDGC